MIRVIVNRDSVAMGDDTESHVEEWEMPDDTRVGEVLLRMHDSYLAGVGGSIAWEVSVLPGATITRSAGGEATGIKPDAGASDIRLALLFIAPRSEEHPDGSTSISHLHRRAGARDRVRELRFAPAQSGEWVFTARYLPQGGLRPIEEYRREVAKSEAQVQAEQLEFRARTYPKLYDENGARRPRR